MNISEITKVASRKKLNADAEKLREKVSRETVKIIKLKVAQDTAYWDLKEKLQQVEDNHERLQQNMVEVQMQHEAISGQYQDELRLRPDTLNKLSSTREICDVLEEYSERLKDTLTRCKSDQASLCEAYQKSGKLVRDMKLQHERSDERNQQLILSLQEKANTSHEHQNQLLQYLSAAKRQADAELSDARTQLAAAHAQQDELAAARNELSRHLEQSKNDIQMKDSTIAKIQKEIKQLIQDYTNQLNELQGNVTKKDKELQEATASIESLQRAVSNQEEFASGLRDQNTQLQEQLLALEDQLQAAQAQRQQAEMHNEDIRKETAALRATIQSLTDCKEHLEKIVNEKAQLLAAAEMKIDEMCRKISELEAEKSNISAELQRTCEQCAAQASLIAELQTSTEQLQKRLDELNALYRTCKEDSEAKIRELTGTIADKEKELQCEAGTIGQLMCEIKAASEAAAKLECTRQQVKKEAEDAREAAKLREAEQAQTIEHMHLQICEKENELTKQMNIIMEMRSEKERLQEKIQGMQCMIDNVQQELSHPHPKQPLGDAPELDDNALAFAPTPPVPQANVRQQNLMKSPVRRSQPPNRNESDKFQLVGCGVAENAKQQAVHSLLFSSLDGDSNMIDPREVNRRFEALTRGEPVKPASLNALKRRKAPSGGRKTIKEEVHVSLSQIKKNLKNDEPRKFFKNARNDNKIKRDK